MANVNEGRVSKKKILEVAKKAQAEHGMCDEIKSVLAELGVTWVEGTYVFTVTVPEGVFAEYDMSTRDEVLVAFRDVINETGSTWTPGLGYNHLVPGEAISFVKNDE